MESTTIQGLCKRFRELNPDFEIVPWHIRNRERAQANVYRWQRVNPDKVRVYRQRSEQTEQGKIKRLNRAHHRRELERNGNFTPQEWQEKLRLFDNKCVYCGKKDNKLTIDHVVPLSLGGRNTIENIVPACAWCNTSKGTSIREVPLSMHLG